MQPARAPIPKPADEREKRIAELREQVAKGEYAVDPAELAKAIVDHHIVKRPRTRQPQDDPDA